MNMLFPALNRVFMELFSPSETGKPQLIYTWLETGTLETKIGKINFFIQYLEPLHDVMQFIK